MKRKFIQMCYGLLLISIMSLTLIVEAREISLNVSEPDWTGIVKEKVEIGEIKYHYRIDLDVHNKHEYCNISVGMASFYDFLGEWATSSLIGEGNTSTGSLSPGESKSIEFIHGSMEPETLGLIFRGYFNTSAYTSDQEKVRIEYQVKVYDDRGRMIIDSEDIDLDDTIGEDPQSDSCSSVLFISILITIGCLSLLYLLRKNHR